MQVRVLSLPLIDKGVLLGEQPASKTGAEGSTPSALARVSVAEQPRHHLAEVGRRVRLPPDTLLLPCDAAGVATCLSSRRDGFESRTGRCSSGRSRAARRPSDTRFEAGSTPAGPTGEWTGAVPAGPHEPSEAGSTPASPTGWSRGAARSARRAHIAEVAGSNPAGTTGAYPRGPAATAPP